MTALSSKIVRRLRVKPQLRYLWVVGKKLDDPLPISNPKIPIKHEILPPKVVEIEARLAHLPEIHRPDIANRIRNGHRCAVSTYDGLVIHAAWIALGKCYSYYLDRQYKLSKTEVYYYGAYTLPEYRGHRIQPASVYWQMQLLNEMGYKRIFAYIEPNNKAAQRMPERLNFCKFGVTGYVEVFGVRWYFHRDGGAFSTLNKRNYWRKV